MNVIYFFIVLALINISMYLIMVQAVNFVKNKSKYIQGTIIIISAILFTVITALIYSGMIGWNIEHFHFEVSPERKLCMEQSVCQTVDSKGNCSTLNNPNLNSANFPPRNSCNSCGASGCHSWTNGWNGNFPMNYNDWLVSDNPVGWKRPDATNVKMTYTPPQASCFQSPLNTVPQQITTPIPREYSNLYNYGKSIPFNPNILPLPVPEIRENFVRPSNLNCTPIKPQKSCQYNVVERYSKYPIENLNEIIMYGSKHCGYCQQMLDKLEEAGLMDYITYKDSNQYTKEMIKNGGSKGVPHFHCPTTGNSYTGATDIDILIEKLS